MQVLLSITSPRMKPFVLQVYCVQPVFSTADGWTICTSDLVIETTLSCYKSDKRCPQKDTTQLLIDFQLLLWHPCNMNGWGEPVNPWEALSFLGYLASSFPGFRSPPPPIPRFCLGLWPYCSWVDVKHMFESAQSKIASRKTLSFYVFVRWWPLVMDLSLKLAMHHMKYYTCTYMYNMLMVRQVEFFFCWPIKNDVDRQCCRRLISLKASSEK